MNKFTINSDIFDNEVNDFIEETLKFVLANRDWWNPLTADKLFSNWNQIRRAMILSVNPKISPFVFINFYTIMIHLLYQWDKPKDLCQFNDYMVKVLRYAAKSGKSTHGLMVDALRDTVGIASRPFLLEDENYKESSKIVEELEEIAHESIVKNIDNGVKGTNSYQKRVNQINTIFEQEKGFLSKCEGDYNESLKHLYQALKFAKKAEWDALTHPIITAIGSVYRLLGNPEEGKREMLHYDDNKKGIQSRRIVARKLEFGKMSTDDKVNLECIKKAEAECTNSGLKERILKSNVYYEKSAVLKRLGHHKEADKALSRAIILGWRDGDDQRLIIY